MKNSALDKFKKNANIYGKVIWTIYLDGIFSRGDIAITNRFDIMSLIGEDSIPEDREVHINESFKDIEFSWVDDYMTSVKVVYGIFDLVIDDLIQFVSECQDNLYSIIIEYENLVHVEATCKITRDLIINDKIKCVSYEEDALTIYYIDGLKITIAL